MSGLIRVQVYRLPVGEYGEMTRGGASSKNAHLYVRHPQGLVSEDGIEHELIFKLEQRSSDYWALKLAYPKPDAEGTYSTGGNIARPCVGTPSQGAKLPTIMNIHDRFETWDEYNRGFN